MSKVAFYVFWMLVVLCVGFVVYWIRDESEFFERKYRQELIYINEAAVGFYRAEGTWPRDASQLHGPSCHGSYCRNRWPASDAWGRAIVFSVSDDGGAFSSRSLGRDGVLSSDDLIEEVHVLDSLGSY